MLPQNGDRVVQEEWGAGTVEMQKGTILLVRFDGASNELLMFSCDDVWLAEE